MRHRRNQPEADLQKAVCEYLALARPSCLWLHIPNGGARSRAEAGILKAMGVRAGAPDLLFFRGNGSWCIELKAPGGKQSPAQYEFECECQERRVPYLICESLDEVHRALIEWGLVDRNRITLPSTRGTAANPGEACPPEAISPQDPSGRAASRRPLEPLPDSGVPLVVGSDTKGARWVCLSMTRRL